MAYKMMARLFVLLGLVWGSSAYAQTNCATANYYNNTFHPGCLSWTDLNNSWAKPPPLGNSTPNNGFFLSLSASNGGSLNGTFAGNPTLSGALTITGSGVGLGVVNNATVAGTLKVGAGVAAPAGGISTRRLAINPIAFPTGSIAAVPVFNLATAISGTITDANVFGWNTLTVGADTGNANGSAALLTDLYMQHNFGGTGFKGNRQPLTITINQTGPVTGTPGVYENIITGLGVGVNLGYGFGGSGVTPSTAAGFTTVINPFLNLFPGFTNGGGGSVMELDYSRQAGSSFVDFIPLLISSAGAPDRVQGTRDDIGLAFGRNDAPGVGRGLKTMFSVGTSGGYPGIATDGVLWKFTPTGGSGTVTVDKGLAWATNAAFTTSSIEVPGMTISGAGLVTLSNNTISIGSSVSAGSPVNFITANGADIRFTPQGNGNVQVNTLGGTGQFQAFTSAMFGGGVVTNLSSGEIGMTKMVASGTATGAGAAKFAVVAGTVPGTAKLIMYAGTSTAPTTIIDNVGGGF